MITGPESTGKTTLAKMLAQEFEAELLEEYARTYLYQLDRPYEKGDVELMAAKHQELEDQLPESLAFLDTDLTVFQVWIHEKYQEELSWIHDQLKRGINKLYLLCDVDVPWEPDPQREHPDLNDRKRLFDAYRNLLDRYNLKYHVVSGDIPARMKKCREIIDSYQ